MDTLKGKIDYIERLNNSVNGNPRFNISINGLILTTKSDYSYVYNIENLYRKNTIVNITYYETKKSFRIETIKEDKNKGVNNVYNNK